MTLHPASTRVILLSGPSGSGKSSLAARTGLPVLNLDDFYKDGDDPTLPQLPQGAGPDWDSPSTWHADQALAAIEALCRTAKTTVPRYSIAASARTGERPLDLGGAPLFIAEGVFAADLIERCTALELLADALCLRGRPGTTFRRRLVRDLREGRKSLVYLLRRGWRLLRAEPGVVARHTALGAHACGRDEAQQRIASAVAAAPVHPRTASAPASSVTATT